MTCPAPYSDKYKQIKLKVRKLFWLQYKISVSCNGPLFLQTILALQACFRSVKLMAMLACVCVCVCLYTCVRNSARANPSPIKCAVQSNTFIGIQLRKYPHVGPQPTDINTCSVLCPKITISIYVRVTIFFVFYLRFYATSGIEQFVLLSNGQVIYKKKEANFRLVCICFANLLLT